MTITMQTMDDLGIKSPPRPQRFVRPTAQLGGNPNNVACRPPLQKKADLVGDFQAQMVDRSMTALPNVFTEVFSMQKAQTDELHKHEKILDDLEEQINTGKKKKDELQQEVRCVMNKIFQLEENIKDSNKTIRSHDLGKGLRRISKTATRPLDPTQNNIFQLEMNIKDSNKTIRSHDSDIRVLVVQLNDKERDVYRTEEYAQAQSRKLERHRETSVSFSEKVKEFEKKSSQVYQHMQEVRQSIRSLKDQEAANSNDADRKSGILSGKMEDDVRTDIDNLKRRLSETNSDTLKNQITEEECKRKKLKQTLQVLQKRNAAQLTKLKRHLKEAQLRNRQRQTQVNHVRDQVREATIQLDQ